MSCGQASRAMRDEDDLAPDDDARPPLRYHPPDDALAHAAEASP